MLIAIDDPLDPRIAAFRDIRERDLVGRQGHFVAEGEVVLRVLAGNPRFTARELLIADKRVAALAPLLTGLPETVPIYCAAQPVIDAIAGFPLHRGILAIADKGPGISPDALLASCPENAVVVVLSAIANHDNMGGIFRNAAAFGAAGLLLDSQCCDPFYRKAIRVSVGGVLRVPFARLPAGQDLLETLERHRFTPLALTPAGSRPLHELVIGGRVAPLFGAEGPGLPPALMARAITVGIAMNEGFDSLNVATTSGIVLHHLLRAQPGAAVCP